MVQILCRTLTGRTVTLDVDALSTAGSVCAASNAKAGIRAHVDCRLLVNGKQLSADDALPAVSAGAEVSVLARGRGGVIEPSLVVLAKKYNQDKKVCRICYARLPIRATNCRKKKCGHTNQLRIKKKLK
jgi:large subunit ribosomal protein L40e